MLPEQLHRVELTVSSLVHKSLCKQHFTYSDQFSFLLKCVPGYSVHTQSKNCSVMPPVSQ